MGWSLGLVDDFSFAGAVITVYADGNNLAWVCPNCGDPLLFIYRQGRTGSHPHSPTHCNGCAAAYYLDPPFGHLTEPSAGNSAPPATHMEICQL